MTIPFSAQLYAYGMLSLGYAAGKWRGGAQWVPTPVWLDFVVGGVLLVAASFVEKRRVRRVQ